MKKYDVLVMGELNVDLILNQLQEFPRMGAEILAREMNLTLGSSSAIFACNAASLGARVAFLGKIGTDDFGNYIVQFLKGRNVSTQHVIRSPDYQTGATIILNFGMDRAMVTHPGAMEFLSGENLTTSILEQVRHLHISSIFLQPRVHRDLENLLKMARAAGCTTSLDTQWDPAEKWALDLTRILPLLDVFLPNETEFLCLTKAASIEAGLSQFGPMGKFVVVKCGDKGSMAWAGGKIHRAAPYLNKEVRDAIGAGDSFDAGFVTRFLQGGDVESCLRWGNLAGALNTTAAGGTTAFSSGEKIHETARRMFGVDFPEL